jgi:hypothetical protein
MPNEFDINKFKNLGSKSEQYEKQITRIRQSGKDVSPIETVIKNVESNLNEGINSFIIYGDPQSGKTEMMIALTAKLLDKGNKIIIILINDNVGLLEQNLDRFSKSHLDPAPKNYRDILGDVYQIRDHKWILFCKKNASDLNKLIEKIGKFEKVVIDDEADYASPNGRINIGERTRINELIGNLLGEIGTGNKYIGVTATPARLDLNNTFKNANDRWVYFPNHSSYTGQSIFFPVNLEDNLKYQLTFLPEQYDVPKYLREALFRFLVNVAYLNLFTNNGQEQCYSMLVHTSGQTRDHLRDHDDIVSVINTLNNENRFEKYVETIHQIAGKKYGENNANDITRYVLTHRNRNATLIINSEKDKDNLEKASNPRALFTFAIGGNIVSRGVTFNNLLSMYFTRTVKTKLQQDTYIQRARMFGSRGECLEYFELTIPEQLYKDWHCCFVFHLLALDSVKNGNPPVWLENRRTKVVATSSLDKTTVQIDSGEMSYEIFDLTEEIEDILSSNIDPLKKMETLNNKLGDAKLPSHLIQFVKHFSPDGLNSLAFHPQSNVTVYRDADQSNISRGRGLIGGYHLEEKKYPHAIHHLKVFFNDGKKARIFYRFVGMDGTKFLKKLGKNE